MALMQYANNAATTLASGITNSATSLNVDIQNEMATSYNGLKTEIQNRIDGDTNVLSNISFKIGRAHV